MNFKRDKKDKKMGGDILGISDTPASTHIPPATTDHGGHPKGIEVGEHGRRNATDSSEGGATGVDMGAGGSGTDISRDRT